MAKKPKPTNVSDYMVSSPVNIIGGRFQVKASVLNTGATKISIMLVIVDVVDENFKIKFFEDSEAASDFIKLLKAV
jgi:hypothetical protein